MRRTQQTYRNDPVFVDPSVRLISLPGETKIFNGAGQQVAYTLLNYDEYGIRALQPAPGLSDAGHDPAYGGDRLRGNVTTVWRAEDGSHLNILTQNTFDIAGNLVKTVDPNGHATFYEFNGDSANLYALPTKITKQQRQDYGANRETRFAYDYSIGKPGWMIEPNGLITYYTYEDPLDRLTRIEHTDGAGLLEKETYSYPSPTAVIRQTDKEVAGDLGLQSQTLADGWGRTIETRQYEGPSQYIRSATSYDELGRVKQTANPSRVDGSGQADGLAFVTTNTYDSLGRITRTVLPDQSATVTGYLGNRVTVRDAAGNARTSVYDALGRLAQVIEDEGGAGHRNYSTVYGYDAQDNLISVNQSGQSRTFVYDGLSRLRSATNPESGVTRYSYDADGNLLTKTDARNVMTCFGTLSGSSCASGYDAFGRLWAKSYSDGTPGVQYTYDAGGGFATGQLTEVANSYSRTSYSGHAPSGGRERRARPPQARATTSLTPTMRRDCCARSGIPPDGWWKPATTAPIARPGCAALSAAR